MTIIGCRKKNLESDKVLFQEIVEAESQIIFEQKIIVNPVTTEFYIISRKRAKNAQWNGFAKNTHSYILYTLSTRVFRCCKRSHLGISSINETWPPLALLIRDFFVWALYNTVLHKTGAIQYWIIHTIKTLYDVYFWVGFYKSNAPKNSQIWLVLKVVQPDPLEYLKKKL